jgi:hypothetical protein
MVNVELVRSAHLCLCSREWSVAYSPYHAPIGRMRTSGRHEWRAIYRFASQMGYHSFRPFISLPR